MVRKDAAAPPRMHIAFVAVTYMRSGTEQLILDLSQRLVADGQTVSIVIPGLPALDSMAEAATAMSVRVERAGDLFGRGRDVRRNACHIFGYFRRERPAIVHLHIPWAPVGFETIIATWMARVPHLVRTEHNPITAPLSLRQRVKMRVLDALVERIVFVSAGNLRQHMANCGRPARKCVVIPNGIPVDEVVCGRSPERRAAARKQLGLPLDATIAVLVASLGVRKGPLDFVRAAARASERASELHYAIIGEGEERSEVGRLTAQFGLGDKMHLLGRRPDVRRILHCFDIYVQPSHYEGMAISMLEALAAGLPMVTTRVDGTDDVLPGERGALFVNVGDVDGLARAMVRLAQDPTLREDLSGISRERVRSHFATDVMYHRYRSLYGQLVAAKPASTPASV